MIAETDVYKMNNQDILRKRRTSSFDNSIVKNFLGRQNQIILPKVNLPLLEE